jgi:hypothetical protein
MCRGQWGSTTAAPLQHRRLEPPPAPRPPQVDVLLDSAASGWNTVEREGISISHPARFILVGSGNPEEGELRPQLLDRCAAAGGGAAGGGGARAPAPDEAGAADVLGGGGVEHA